MARRNEYIKRIDRFIGQRVYSLRLAIGLTRQQLAGPIEVSHQQLRKYEKGINRISAGRLVMLAKVLGKNVDYFYEGLDLNITEIVVTQHQHMCATVSRNFMKIDCASHQKAVHILVRSLAKK